MRRNNALLDDQQAMMFGVSQGVLVVSAALMSASYSREHAVKGFLLGGAGAILALENAALYALYYWPNEHKGYTDLAQPVAAWALSVGSYLFAVSNELDISYNSVKSAAAYGALASAIAVPIISATQHAMLATYNMMHQIGTVANHIGGTTIGGMQEHALYQLYDFIYDHVTGAQDATE